MYYIVVYRQHISRYIGGSAGRGVGGRQGVFISWRRKLK